MKKLISLCWAAALALALLMPASSCQAAGKCLDVEQASARQMEQIKGVGLKLVCFCGKVQKSCPG